MVLSLAFFGRSYIFLFLLLLFLLLDLLVYNDIIQIEEGKKFKYKPFRDMLLKISSLSMDEQLRIVEDRFDNWKKDVEQVDDIILLGIKF